MRRPWMPLFIGDFIADTMHLGATETGIYIRLLIHCWKHEGRIPRDPRKLAMIGHCDSRLWRQYAPTVLAFFKVVDDASMENERLSTELRRCGEISNKRKAAALQKHSKSSANAKAKKEHFKVSECVTDDVVEASTAQRSNDLFPNEINEPSVQKHTQSHSHTEREEKKERQTRRASALPVDWEPDRGFARSKGFTEPQIDEQLCRFRDHAAANGRKQIDWDASWRNWITSPYQRGPPKSVNGHSSYKDQKQQDWDNARQALRESIERDEREESRREADGLLPALPRR